MSAHIRYTPLEASTGDSATLKQSKFAFPKISRLKCVSIGFIALLTLVMVAISCIQSGYISVSSICRPTRNEDTNTRGSGISKIRISHMKRRLPQCIIIGARKAGTRALLTYMNLHPDIVTIGLETHFFDENYEHSSLETYRKQMPPSYEGQITVEKTPAYFTDHDVPERVHRMNRTVKLLLILRDPVERAISDYLQIAEHGRLMGRNPPTFEQKAVDSNGEINRSYKAVSRSVYHRHLAIWLEFFPLSQIHIIDSEVFLDDPASVMTEVEDFLGIEHRIKSSNFYFNETKGFYCVQTEEYQKCLKDSKGRKHPHIDPEVIRKLKEYFHPHNMKLFRQIGRTFNW